MPWATGAMVEQTFKVYPEETDINGKSYGALPTNAWGPRGEILTDQEWYYRRHWTNSDSEVYEGGTTYTFRVELGHQLPTFGPKYESAEDCFGNFMLAGNMAMPSSRPVTSWVPTEMNLGVDRERIYEIGTFNSWGYSAAKETNGMQALINWLDKIGTKLANQGGYWDSEGNQITGGSSYDITRHSY
jgi:hypothetical protein